MSSVGAIKQIIIFLLQDGKVHSLEEIRALVVERHIELGKKDQNIRNAVYALKKSNSNFISVDKGLYQMKVEKEKAEGECEMGGDFRERMCGGEEMLNSDLMQLVNLKLEKIKHINWKKDPIEQINEGRRIVQELEEVKDFLVNADI